MLLKLRHLAIPLSLFLVASCGDDGDGNNGTDPDADVGGNPDADVTGVCGEFNGPAGIISSYPGNFTGDVLGAANNFDVAAGICLDERSHFAQEGEDQVVRLDNLTPGTSYVIQLDAASDLAFYVATSCSDMNLAAGECLLFVDEAGGQEAGDFVAPDSGTVFVVVDHFGADPVEDGGYTLSVFEPDCTVDDDCSGTPDTPFCSDFTCVACANSFQCDTTGAPVCDGTTNTCVAGFDTCTGDDPSPPESQDDGPAGATVLNPAANTPDVVTGNICSAPAEELDFFTFTVAEGDSRVISLDWTGAADAPDLDLYLFDDTGAVINNSFFDKPEVLIAQDLAAGDYYVAVGKFETDGVPVPAAVAYTLTASVPECETSFDCLVAGSPVCGPALTCDPGPAECTGDDASEPNDGPAAATPLTSGVAKAGAICNTPATESDFYSIAVANGNDLSVSLSYTDNAAADLDLQIFDSTGENLGFTFWKNPEVVSLSFLPAGTYIIQVTYFGAAVTAAHPYSLTATVTNNGTCTTAADCANVFNTQVFRGNCSGGACSFIQGNDALAQDALCDSNDDCTSGVCSYMLFQDNAETSVCTVGCTATSECTAAHGAGFSCTVPFTNNFCHPNCGANLDCGANPNSMTLDDGQPWDYLTCTTGSCDVDP